MIKRTDNRAVDGRTRTERTERFSDDGREEESTESEKETSDERDRNMYNKTKRICLLFVGWLIGLGVYVFIIWA